VIPDIIYGWDHDETKRKPDPYPVNEVIKRFGLERNEVLVLDDLKPGLLMARKAKVDFAAAGWAYDIPLISVFMKEHSDYYFRTIDELKDMVIDGYFE
jgi:phosphoglycolate phosphatase-like HAD superfamily hydrolase